VAIALTAAMVFALIALVLVARGVVAFLELYGVTALVAAMVLVAHGRMRRGSV
jgi:hypothetical protein